MSCVMLQVWVHHQVHWREEGGRSSDRAHSNRSGTSQGGEAAQGTYYKAQTSNLQCDMPGSRLLCPAVGCRPWDLQAAVYAPAAVLPMAVRC